MKPAPEKTSEDRQQKPRSRYRKPVVRVVSEEEVLAAFQMTAAEISAASCWWSACPTGCP